MLSSVMSEVGAGDIAVELLEITVWAGGDEEGLDSTG